MGQNAGRSRKVYGAERHGMSVEDRHDTEKNRKETGRGETQRDTDTRSWKNNTTNKQTDVETVRESPIPGIPGCSQQTGA